MTNDPERLREALIDARRISGRSQDEIDAAYRASAAAIGMSAPKSITNKLRDRRRPFDLDGRSLALLVGAIGPTAGHLIAADDGENRTDHQDGGEPQTGNEHQSDEETAPDAANVVSITGNGPMLRVEIDMDLDQRQLERLSLTIPVYMMRLGAGTGSRTRCRIDIPIFPYQAEMVMRAIHGGRS